MIKDGKQHIESLRDGRRILYNGTVVEDTTTHPAFRNTVAAAAARLYDYQSAPENRDLMTFRTPDTDEVANRIWQLPRSYDDLVKGRQALEAWSAQHAGFLGRAPDHVASCVSGMYMGRDLFESYDKKRAGALKDYYKYARDNDIYLAYVIINPQADRSKEAHEQQTEDLVAGVVDQDDEGITLRGAKMLATGGVLCNEVFVSCIQPLKPGDEPYAITCAVPMNTNGLKILSRKSYEGQADNVFDNPLSSRFDENDSVLHFEDVKVPWDRVFVNQNVEMCFKQWHETPTHVYMNYQAQVRLKVKLRFLLGLARRIADTNGVTGFPQVREILGNLAAEVAMVDAFVNAMEAKGHYYGEYFIPDRHMMYSSQTLTQELYPKIVTTLRQLAGGGMIMLPSSIKDFDNPEARDIIHRTQQSPASGSEDRVKLFRLAWDAVGSEFGSRHTQYEMFYAGASFVVKNHSFRTYDWDASAAMVDDMLNSYSLAEELRRSRSNEGKGE